MKCMHCGAELGTSAYCPSCGKDVSVQKQAVFASELYYNRGLEKAQIRDLSGAMEQLKQSLKFNKLNVDARNLLGLVYFEIGEVVSALTEWVISRNIQPVNNIAETYISEMRKDPGKLDEINDTIKKFNIALNNCKEGNEDVAVIQLKKILTKNPKLVKCYHLLALLYMKNGDYERARRLLIKAARIDRTNTVTLRYLKEVDEQTGKPTNADGILRFSPARRVMSGRRRKRSAQVPDTYTESDVIIPSAYKETSPLAIFWNLAAGLIIGMAIVGFLIMPARISKINREKNEEITKYSTAYAERENEIARLTAQIEADKNIAADGSGSITDEKRAETYESLLMAMLSYQSGRESETVEYLMKVDTSLLSEDELKAYNNIRNEFPDSMFESQETIPVSASSVQGETESSSDAGQDNSDGQDSGYSSEEDTYDSENDYSDDEEYSNDDDEY